MPRYYLKNPKNGAEILVQRGQSWDEPIYKGKDSNDYYILKWGRDLKRRLFPFDPTTAKINGTPFDVADSWTGEPRVIGLDEDLWGDLQTQRDINTEHLLEQLIRDLIEGDTIRLTRDGDTIGYLRAVREGNQWTVVRSQ
jgi:hypothetical protein